MAHPDPGKGHRKKHAHAAPHEEHASVDAPFWFISWADLMTLLFALFVALFSISTLSEERLKEFLSGIKAEWGTGGEGVSALEALQEGKTQMVAPRRGYFFKGDAKHPGPSLEETLIPGRDRAARDLRTGSRLVRGGRIRFAPGQSRLDEAARADLLEVATAIRGFRTRVDVRGYATGKEVPSGNPAEAWDMAYQRAKEAAGFLSDPRHGNLMPHRIRIVVGGPVDPVSLSPEENQRVEVIDTEEFTHFPWQTSHWLHQQWLTEARRAADRTDYPPAEVARLRTVREGMTPQEVVDAVGEPLARQRFAVGEEAFEEWRYPGGTLRFFVHLAGDLGTVVAVGDGKGWRFTE